MDAGEPDDSTPGAVDAPTEEQGIVPVKAPEPSFEWKYQGYSREMLSRAFEDFSVRYTELTTTTFDQEYAAGRFELVYQTPGDPLDSYKRSEGLVEHRVDESYDGADGRLRLKVAYLSREWHPEVFAMQEEFLWLLRKTSAPE